MNWTKTPPTKPGAYWLKAQSGSIKCCEVFTDKDGNSIAQGFGVSDDVNLLRGEWSELVPAEELAKAQAQCAAKDAALRLIVDFGCVSHNLGCPEDDTCNCRIPSAIKSAISPDCGSDYVHRSEVEKAYREATDHVGEVFPKIRNDLQNVVDINFASSRARKVATGKTVT